MIRTIHEMGDDMMMRSVRRGVAGLGVLATSALMVAAGSFHLTLVDSRPRQDAVVAESPPEIWLLFNEPPDLSRCGISVRGPAGTVELAPLEAPDSLAISAKIRGELAPGEYTVAWLATSLDDHSIRGRYRFTIYD
jgi:methionine-rich copper-binding protein CopC